MKMNAKGEMKEMVSSEANVRTRVHEYGGGAFAVGKLGFIYSNFADNRLYWGDTNDEIPPKAVPITSKGPLRFADFHFHPEGSVVVAVCEDHTKPAPADVRNYLVLIDVVSQDMEILTSGSDFYSAPRFSPDGKKLCWVEWNHPEMPWTSSALFVANFERKIGLSQKARRAGEANGKKISISQPRWLNNSILLFVSDESGYYNICRTDHYNTASLTKPVLGDFSEPDWTLGNCTYTATSTTNSIIARYYSPLGQTMIARIAFDTGILENIAHPFLTVDRLEANRQDSELLYVTASTKTQRGLFAFNMRDGTLRLLRTANPTDDDRSLDKSDDIQGHISAEMLSHAQPISFEVQEPGSCEGRQVYGFFYAPVNPTYHAPEGTLPPLLMRVHGGPTSFSPPVTSLQISYWTSRGFAFFSLNYGGSSSFGRRYRMSLDGRWGLLDTADAIAAAKYLATSGLVDGSRMSIDGGSAGGFTVMNALAHSDTFAAGVSLYGVADCTLLARDTHKFESQYLYSLIGGTPESIPDVYQERSPLYHADKIQSSLLILQGSEDMIVPLNQAQQMYRQVEEAGGNCSFVVFEGEGHGFRSESAVKASLDHELAFLLKYLKLTD